MATRPMGLVPNLGSMLKANNIPVRAVVEGTRLAEKSVRRMVNNDGYSLASSIGVVIKYLDTRGVRVPPHEFVAVEP